MTRNTVWMALAGRTTTLKVSWNQFLRTESLETDQIKENSLIKLSLNNVVNISFG
jgi:hypothetical protein